MQVPNGVKAIAIWNAIVAVTLIVLAICGTEMPMTEIMSPAEQSIQSTGAYTSAVMLVQAAIFAVVGYGLWNLKNWARIAQMLISGISVAVVAITAFFAPNISLIVALLIHVAILAYLMSDDVEKIFT